MKLKKVLMLTAACLSVLAFTTACGDKTAQKQETSAESTQSQEKKEEKGKIAYIVGALGDKSFNDSGEVGMKKLRELGYDCKTLEIGDESKSDKWEDGILDLIDQGYTYLVASSTYRDVFLKVAKEYPENKFIIFDEKMDESELPDNVALIFYAQNEGSYMVGQLAAGMTKSKVVSINVGMDNPVIADFVVGFINGVQDYDPSVKVVKATVGSWTEPAKMKELCLSQARDQKADVFYQVAGASGGGLFEACKENGTWAIGVDSDQYQYYKDSENPELADVILTSMLKNVGDSIVSLFAEIEEGKDVWKKVNVLGLKEQAIGYVDNEYFKEKVPEEIRNKMKTSMEDIIAGNKKVLSYYDLSDENEYQKILDSVKP